MTETRRPYIVDACSVCGDPMPCPATRRQLATTTPRYHGPCTEPGCDDPSVSRGLCSRHYHRARYVAAHPNARAYRRRAS